MNKETIIKAIRALHNHKNALLDIIKKFMTNPAQPLDDRWEIFTHVHEFLPTEGSYMKFKSLGDNWSWYDDMNADRQATVVLEQLVYSVKDMQENGGWDHIDLAALKEEILASGYGRFINDW